MYVCSCFGITEKQVREHADSGVCTPRQIASASKAGTDCGSCVRRIQALLGRGAGCPRREVLDRLGADGATTALASEMADLSPALASETADVPSALPAAEAA
ncbi:(2Fe-2S)-binding protein [Streptomyces zagrosensis]|uniref:Bacterioferritin-associated ferredoxin n=1 Tax=Streptomyces zagrosensis TaxID=1042984 RepID=A0A7W9UWE6_9ACTN|nr:(2Fe-2S)-binding protein [Streptomyces zagrosensis]MBB5933452.1 bacterioferritin-associated ferredoxin [Streptomyces zagrosensis]